MAGSKENDMKTQAISLDKIVTDGGTQMRVTLLESAVAEYSGLLSDAKQWPFDSPLTVFHDGTDYYLADGFHRYMAAVRSERSSAPCNVIAGSVRDAVKYALSANARHGLRRTNEDKRKAVQTALADEEWSKLSSRAIAEICGVSPGFVDGLRTAEVPTVGTSVKNDAAKHEVSKNRVGRNGVSQPSAKSSGKVKDNAITEETGVQKKVAPLEPFAEQQDFAAVIYAAATHLDRIIDTVREMAGQPGGVWLDTTSIETQAKSIKAEIRSAAFWIVCPACDGQGCKECRKHGWLAKSRKPFLTTAMIAKMEAAK